MLEIAATAWLWALVTTVSLFVLVLLGQSAARRARALSRTVRRLANWSTEHPELAPGGHPA